uniref:Putative conserved plasma membrane protein n=1 Tax=Anopheles triannulatus TaxID=58253 RepID=A0A2M4ARC7_9DIPT
MKRQRVKAVANNRHVYVEDAGSGYDEVPLAEQRSVPAERCLEAQILPGDTLQALALRFNCSIPVLKKLNKIDKDNEIYARNVIRIPLTAHSILLDTLPRVHTTSGNSSPKNITNHIPGHHHLPVESKEKLDEKLIVAAVSNASYVPNAASSDAHAKSSENYREPRERAGETSFDAEDENSSSQQPLLLSGEYDDSLPQPRSLRLPTNDFSCNGSDCDISWICLLVFILALCFAIPLIYVVYVAEHIEKFHHDSFNDNHSTKW